MIRLKVLFLCNHNSARSQMAEGLMRNYHGARHEAFSAGSSPTHVHPTAIRAMAELGIDISGHRSKGVGEFMGEEFDTVVSVCQRSAREVCAFCSSPLVKQGASALVPRARQYIQKPFRDPAYVEGGGEAQLHAFRETVEGILIEPLPDISDSGGSLAKFGDVGEILAEMTRGRKAPFR
jgi:arsenate reductase